MADGVRSCSDRRWNPEQCPWCRKPDGEQHRAGRLVELQDFFDAPIPPEPPWWAAPFLALAAAHPKDGNGALLWSETEVLLRRLGVENDPPTRETVELLLAAAHSGIADAIAESIKRRSARSD